MKILVLLLSLTGFANSYAPTLESVVVLFDIPESAYSPFLFHHIMGETLDLKMHESCPKIAVKQGIVYCLNERGYAKAAVGIISKAVGQDGFWQIRSVKWHSNVEILETRTPRGLIYSLKLK